MTLIIDSPFLLRCQVVFGVWRGLFHSFNGDSTCDSFDRISPGDTGHGRVNLILLNMLQVMSPSIE